jgi:hypothetical protein
MTVVLVQSFRNLLAMSGIERVHFASRQNERGIVQLFLVVQITLIEGA